MSYSLVGCMLNSSAGWVPVWPNPCGVTSLVGCMINSSAGWAPKLLGGIGLCTDDKTGCMQLIGGQYRPVLIYEEYDSAGELVADCCFVCDTCDFDDEQGFVPRFVEVTFSDIIWCPGEPTAGFPSPNQTFILEWDQSFTNCMDCQAGITDACGWVKPHPSFRAELVVETVTSSGLVHTLLMLYSNSGLAGCTSCTGGLTPLVFLGAIAGAPFPATGCFETDFDNFRDAGDCGGNVNDGHSGTAVINWNP